MTMLAWIFSPGAERLFLDHDSMWPLLKRDGLALQYVMTLLLWNRLIGYNPFRLPDKSFIRWISLVSSHSAIRIGE